jgi:hypothetical protein
MKKGTMFFALLISIMAITGCKEEVASVLEEVASVFGVWTTPSVTADFLVATNAVITLNNDGTFSLAYQTTAANTQAGTFSPTTLPANTDITFTVVSSSGPDAPPPATAYLIKYSSLTVSTFDLYMDLQADGYQGPFSMTKQ